MTIMNKFNRRQFLRLGLMGGTLVAGGGLLSGCVMPSGMMNRPRMSVAPASPTATTGRAVNRNFAPDLEINLSATAAQATILPGAKTTVWRYEASVVKGDPNSVITLPDNYLGPIIKVRTGQKIRVNMTNNLPSGEAHIVHWHGLHLPEDMDGHPRYSVANGKSYVYEFEVKNRAGTYWFHPHTHERTAEQVMMGLAGLFIVSDDEEAALGLPSGEFDVPIIIQDRTFDANNQMVYTAGEGVGMMGRGQQQGSAGMMGNNGAGMGGMDMQRMMGFLGERILINGKPDFVLPAVTRAYRLRLLNGSNSRIYKLGWSDGMPMTVIATDGGLLEKPAQRDFVMLGPGERVEIWADFSERKVGETFTLQSLKFEGAESTAMGGMGMGGMMSQGNAPALGAPLTLMTMRIDNQVGVTSKLPTQLSKLNRLRIADAVNQNNPRQFRLQMRQMNWQINGRSFEMDAVASDEQVKLGTTEVWEFINELNPGEMMEQMGMAHPFHIHGVQFNIIERQALPELKAGWDSVRAGFVDDGWKDTFLIMPGERVKVLMRFADYSGKFVFHCHNLEHEDMGMMRNYEVVA